MKSGSNLIDSLVAVGVRATIDDAILPHQTFKRTPRSLVMLKDKNTENIWRKHESIPP
jgi:acetyl-CoA carboxylase carboxyltransferase component